MRIGWTVLGLFVLALVLTPLAFAGEKAACDVGTVKVVKTCGSCGTDLAADKAECCGEKAEGVEYCVKVVYGCSACGKSSAKAKDCCGSAMAKSDDRAKTFWKCPGCDAKAEAKGKCGKCEKDLVKSCEKSGKAPHMAAAKAEEKKAG